MSVCKPTELQLKEVGKSYASYSSHLFRRMTYGEQQCAATPALHAGSPASSCLPQYSWRSAGGEIQLQPCFFPPSQLLQRNCCLIKSVPTTHCPNPLRLSLWLDEDTPGLSSSCTLKCPGKCYV